MCQHAPNSLHDFPVHPFGHAIQLWLLRHNVFELDSLRPAIILELPPVFSSIVRTTRFQLPAGFPFHSRVDNTWSFVSNGETHNFRLWSSMNVMKYCDPTCDFVSSWHTSVCTSSINSFRLIDGLARKEIWFCLPAKHSVHFSSYTFLTSGITLSSVSLRIPF